MSNREWNFWDNLDYWWCRNGDRVMGFVYVSLLVGGFIGLLWLAAASEQHQKAEYLTLCAKQGMTADQCELRYKELQISGSANTEYYPIYIPSGK